MRFLAVSALVLSACHLVEPEGRRQTSSFSTPYSREEARSRAEGWLAERGLYDVTRSEPGFVRGERRRARTVGSGDQIDVLSVTLTTGNLGTRAEVEAITFLLDARGSREQADQVSPEAIRDEEDLSRVLMARS